LVVQAPPGSEFGVAHAVAMGAEVAEHLRDARAVWRLRTQRHPCPNDALDPIGRVAQPMAIRVELHRGGGGIGPVGGVEGVFEVLGRMVEVDELDAIGQCIGEERPVVLRPIGELDHREVGALGEYRLDLGGDHCLQCRLVRFGHPAHAHAVKPLPLGIDQRERRIARFAVSAAGCAHRRQHPVERDHHRAGGGRDLAVGLAHRRLEVLTACLPARRERFG